MVRPWVVGLYKSKREVRFFIVPNRTGATLGDIIKRSVRLAVSFVRTNGRDIKGCLMMDLLKNRKPFSVFPQPRNGNTHTQGVERIWFEAKNVMKRQRRPTTLLQSRLDEFVWRLCYRDAPQSLLSCFWRDVYTAHNLSSLQ